ncbi:MAG: gluconate 2-dehydrogenase subunit 3 family protein [Bacteroidota bacterium]
MDRREALKHTAIILGAVSASSVMAVMSGCKAGKTRDWTPVVLTEGKADLVAAISERIIPKSETPGAMDAEVDAFIDMVLNGYVEEKEKQAFLAGLADVEARAQSKHQDAFVDLTAEQQDAILTELANETEELAFPERAKAFFPKIKELTITGYFTSELVAEKHLHYQPVPGDYLGCVDIDEVGNLVYAE